MKLIDFTHRARFSSFLYKYAELIRSAFVIINALPQAPVVVMWQTPILHNFKPTYSAHVIIVIAYCLRHRQYNIIQHNPQNTGHNLQYKVIT